MTPCFERSFKEPESNLAYDEALLLEAEKGKIPECVRIWESPTYFVVLGLTSKIKKDVIVSQCRKENIPILRRASGGGTVLQGPGCLNYSLILSTENNEKLKNINSSYRWILKKLQSAIQAKGLSTMYCPISDLSIDGKKFSGNAQIRKKHFLLHHGTILYQFNISQMGMVLCHPPKEPDYRRGRDHRDFITNIPLPRHVITTLITSAFHTTRVLDTGAPKLDLRALIKNKYKNLEWINRF